MPRDEAADMAPCGSMRRIVVALLAVAAPACSTGGGAPATGADAGPTGPPGGPPTVQVVDFGFELPGPIAADEPFVVVNAGGVEHTFTAESAGIFSGTIAPGGEVVLNAPEQPGSYPVVCTVHPDRMQATLEVRP